MKINRRRAEWRAASLPLSHVFVRDVRLHPADLLHRLLLLLLLVFWIHQNHQFLGSEEKKQNRIVDLKFKRKKKKNHLWETHYIYPNYEIRFFKICCVLSKTKKTKWINPRELTSTSGLKPLKEKRPYRRSSHGTKLFSSIIRFLIKHSKKTTTTVSTFFKV